MAARKKSRSAACKKAWATRRKRARERSERAKRGWKTRKRNQRRRKQQAEVRAERASRGWARKRAKTPGFIPIVQQLFPPPPEPPKPPTVLPPDICSEESIDAIVAGFAKRRIHPDEWARDLADMCDLEVGPLYKAYFAIVSP